MPTNTDIAAKAAFLASLPTGKDGLPIGGHTTWEMLGPESKDRWSRIAQAVFSTIRA